MKEGPQELVEGDTEEDDQPIDGPQMNFNFLQPQVDLVSDANALIDKWLKVKVNPNDYLYGDVQPLTMAGR